MSTSPAPPVLSRRPASPPVIPAALPLDTLHVPLHQSKPALPLSSHARSRSHQTDSLPPPTIDEDRMSEFGFESHASTETATSSAAAASAAGKADGTSFYPVPPHPRWNSSSCLLSATCAQPMRRLNTAGSVSLLNLASTEPTSLEPTPRSGQLFLLRQLRRRTGNGLLTDPDKFSPSPPEDSESRGPSPEGFDEYHDLTGGFDPYDMNEGAGDELDDERASSATWAERCLECVWMKAQRIGEIACSCLMSFSVIFSLFAEPIRLGFMPRSFDGIFLVTTICVFTLFLVEAAIYWFYGYFQTNVATPPTNPPSPSAHDTSPQPLPFQDDDTISDHHHDTTPAASVQLDTAFSQLAPPPRLQRDHSQAGFSSLLNLCSTHVVNVAQPLWAKVVTLLPSSLFASHLSLELVLDYLSIVSLVPDILYQAHFITLTRFERDILMIFKAGFLIRLIALIRCMQFPIDIFQLWLKVTDQQWWLDAAQNVTLRALVGLKHLPSPIAKVGEAFVYSHAAAVGLRKIVEKQQAQEATPIDALVPSASPNTSPTPPAVNTSATPKLVQYLSPHSRSSLASGGSNWSTPSIGLASSLSPSSGSGVFSSVTPPAMLGQLGIALTNTTPSTTTRSTGLRGAPKEHDSPASDVDFPQRLSTGSSRSTSASSQAASLVPFSPQIPAHLNFSSQQLTHHRSPLLLNRQLSGTALARDRPMGLGPSPTDKSPRPAPSTSANKLISLSAMSPLAHRRVLSSGTSPVPLLHAATTGHLLSPSSASGPGAGIGSGGPVYNRILSLPGVSGSPVQARRELGLHPNSAMRTSPQDALGLIPTPSPRHQSGPPSRIFSLSAMSPMVSQRSLLTRQAQQHAHLHQLISPSAVAHSSAQSSTASTPTNASPAPFASPPANLGLPPPPPSLTPSSSSMSQLHVHESPLTRNRSLHGTPNLSIRTVTGSPALSSRALSGMAALRQSQAAQSAGEHRSSNLTPPLLSIQPNSGGSMDWLTPDISPITQARSGGGVPFGGSVSARETTPPTSLSRSACTSPVMRHRRPTGSPPLPQHPHERTGENEPILAATMPSRIGSPASYDIEGSPTQVQQPHTPLDPYEEQYGEEATSDESSATSSSSSQFSHASQIGQLLSDYTAHRVIIGLLLVLFVWHVCHPLHLDTRPKFGLERIQHHYTPYALLHYQPLSDKLISEPGPHAVPSEFPPPLSALVRNYQRIWNDNLLFFRIGSYVLRNETDRIDSLRHEEIQQLRTKDCESWFDIRRSAQRNAQFDLCTMVWLILMLPILICVIYKDVHAVVTPIERMVSFVTQLARDPLSQLGMVRGSTDRSGCQADIVTPNGPLDPTLIVDVSREMDLMAKEPDGAMLLSRPNTGNLLSVADRDHSATMASSFVELTLQKLALLLQVGFGSAGGEIIAQNVIGDHLNPMVPGSKVFAIFGFCDIQDFNKTTEILEESIMVFVNQIAEIVHDSAQHFGGQVNKNIGSAFLLVWKFDPADMKALKSAIQHSQRHSHSKMGTPSLRALPAGSKDLSEPLPPLLLARPSSRQAGLPPPLLPLHSMSRPVSRAESRPETAPKTRGMRERSASMRDPDQRDGPHNGAAESRTRARASSSSHKPAAAELKESLSIIPPAPSSDMTLHSSPVSQPGHTPLTEENLRSHDGGSATPNKSQPSSRLASRRLSDRRLSIMSDISLSGTTPSEADDMDTLLQPRLHRYSTDVSTLPTGNTTPFEFGSRDEVLMPPSAMTPIDVSSTPIGEGEWISKPMPAPGEDVTPVLSLSTLTTDSRAPSGFSTPSLSSNEASNASSTMHSGLSTPKASDGSSSSHRSSHVSTALTRLMKLDSDSMRSREHSSAIRLPFRHNRRMSQQFVPSPSPIDENDPSMSAEPEERKPSPPFLMPLKSPATATPAPVEPNASESSSQTTNADAKNDSNPATSADPSSDPSLPSSDPSLTTSSDPVASSDRTSSDGPQSSTDTGATEGEGSSSAAVSEETHSGGSNGSCGTATTTDSGISPPPLSRLASSPPALPPPSGKRSSMSVVSTPMKFPAPTIRPPSTVNMHPRANAQLQKQRAETLAQQQQRHQEQPSHRRKRSDSISSVAGSSKASTPLVSTSQRFSPPSPPVRTTIHRIAHQALAAFLSNIIQIATANSIVRWKTDASLQARMPAGYDGPTLGLGLHVGWAIEGAIGSSHKIDASYLSPNVNLAARLCSATRQYKVPFLFSGQFYRLLDVTIQKRCRHLDQVLVKGSGQPMDLYTFDISPGWKKAAAASVASVMRDQPSAVASELMREHNKPASAPSTPASLPYADYAQMRTEWMHQVAAINFKLPARKPSNASSTSSETAAAAAAAESTAQSAGGSAASSGINSAEASQASSQRGTPQIPLRSHSTSSVHSSASTASSSSQAGAHSRPGSTSDAHASANASIIAQLNTLLAQLQCDLPEKYVELFNRGIKYYIAGDWQQAGKYLVKFQTLHREKVAAAQATSTSTAVTTSECEKFGEPISSGTSAPTSTTLINTVDGPSNLILQFMGKHAFQAPKGWKGYRKLDQK